MPRSEASLRGVVALAALALGAALVTVLSLSTEPCTDIVDGCDDRFWGDLLLDRSVNYHGATAEEPGPQRSIYPFTVQNVMWLLFLVGLGEIALRTWSTNQEARQLERGLLPEDDETMLRAEDLGEVQKRITAQPDARQRYLQRLVSRSILQFQSSRSIDQTNSLFSSSLELIHHEIELNFDMLRYIVWLIPTLGFIGTVIGISLALSVAGSVPDLSAGDEAVRQWMKQLTSSLGVAFYTTLLALLLSAVLVFLLHFAQARQELTLNRVSQYCLDNLINRLYEK